MIETELDRPQDKEIACLLCGKALKVTHHWVAVINRWLHPSCHNRCVEDWQKNNKINSGKNAQAHEVPKRFEDFQLGLLPDQGAARSAGNFDPTSAHHALAIIGPRGTGKSRLMWKTVETFFGDLGTGWPEYALFPDIMTDFDRALIGKLKNARYAFIDDIGSTESYGRERALLQDVIRSRVQKQQWTFLTIDDPSFDPGFEDLFRDRAHVIYVK
jgi:DNA replication protein DnaC